MKSKGELDSAYKGNEYMSIYSTIVRRDKGDIYSDGSSITPGYYVRTLNENGRYSLTSLEKWFENS